MGPGTKRRDTDLLAPTEPGTSTRLPPEPPKDPGQGQLRSDIQVRPHPRAGGPGGGTWRRLGSLADPAHPRHRGAVHPPFLAAGGAVPGSRSRGAPQPEHRTPGRHRQPRRGGPRPIRGRRGRGGGRLVRMATAGERRGPGGPHHAPLATPTRGGQVEEVLYRHDEGAREITLLPGVTACFRSFHPLVLDLVEGAWSHSSAEPTPGCSASRPTCATSCSVRSGSPSHRSGLSSPRPRRGAASTVTTPSREVRTWTTSFRGGATPRTSGTTSSSHTARVIAGKSDHLAAKTPGSSGGAATARSVMSCPPSSTRSGSVTTWAPRRGSPAGHTARQPDGAGRCGSTGRC